MSQCPRVCLGLTRGLFVWGLLPPPSNMPVPLPAATCTHSHSTHSYSPCQTYHPPAPPQAQLFPTAKTRALSCVVLSISSPLLSLPS